MTLFYLLPEDWSKRYDHTFFTVKLESCKELTTPPTGMEGIGGKTNHPAVYFALTIFCQHKKRTLYRRYSNFVWMNEQLKASPPLVSDGSADAPLSLPPGTCFFQKQDDAFLQNRLEELQEYVRSLLKKQGYAKHPAVVSFFELDRFQN